MKKIIIYLLVLITFITTCIVVFFNYHNNLESYFVGEWEETQWEYEEADNYLLKALGYQTGMVDVEDIRYHKGEKWVFKKDGELVILQSDAAPLTATWTLKGRGNILEISGEKVTEYFDIKKKMNGEVEMQYMSEIQVKENAKLVFKQSNKV